MIMYIKTDILIHKYISEAIYFEWQVLFYLLILFLMSILKAFEMSSENICTGIKLVSEEQEGACGGSVCNISPCGDFKGIQACGSDGKHCKSAYCTALVGMKCLISRSDLWLFSSLACPRMQYSRCALLTSLKTEKGKIDWSITQIVIRAITLSSAEGSVFRCGLSWAELLF